MMITQEKTAEVDQSLSITKRRAYMTLPLVERRKHIAGQAERMAEYYVQEPERIVWQGADIVEPESLHLATWRSLARQL